MKSLPDLYRAAFRRLAGKGLGLGIFNRLHALAWAGWLAPESVEVEGLRLYLPKDDTGVSQVFHMEGAFEPLLTERFKAAVRPGMAVLDVGANIGYYTLLASKLVGNSGKVVAVEPELGNLVFLARNVLANACANVLIAPCAASEADGEVTLYLSGPSRSGHSILPPEGGARRTQRAGAAALDRCVAPLRPNVIKMDIEGAEALALRGMRRLIEDPALETVFIECNRDALLRRGSSAEEVLKPLRDAGFRARDVDGANFHCVRA